ncbi:protein of unknown function [Streptomyces murinus]
MTSPSGALFSEPICYRFLYLIKAPGCAPLRRARSRLSSALRSCLRPAPRALRRHAPTCG